MMSTVKKANNKANPGSRRRARRVQPQVLGRQRPTGNFGKVIQRPLRSVPRQNVSSLSNMRIHDSECFATVDVKTHLEGASYEVGLNPGCLDFPKLSQLAGLFDKYVFHSVKVTCVPDGGFAAAGSHCIAFDPDPQDGGPQSYNAMLSYSTAASGGFADAISLNITRQGGLDSTPLYVRDPDGSVPFGSDLRTSDTGTIFYRAHGNTADASVRLYIEYDITFSCPQIRVAYANLVKELGGVGAFALTGWAGPSVRFPPYLEKVVSWLASTGALSDLPLQLLQKGTYSIVNTSESPEPSGGTFWQSLFTEAAPEDYTTLSYHDYPAQSSSLTEYCHSIWDLVVHNPLAIGLAVMSGTAGILGSTVRVARHRTHHELLLVKGRKPPREYTRGGRTYPGLVELDDGTVVPRSVALGEEKEDPLSPGDLMRKLNISLPSHNSPTTVGSDVVPEPSPRPALPVDTDLSLWEVVPGNSGQPLSLRLRPKPVGGEKVCPADS